jgi:hypothetical protein
MEENHPWILVSPRFWTVVFWREWWERPIPRAEYFLANGAVFAAPKNPLRTNQAPLTSAAASSLYLLMATPLPNASFTNKPLGGRFCRVESKTQERSHPVHFSIKFTLESGIAWRRFNVSEL